MDGRILDIYVDDIGLKDEEKETTTALIKGVVAGFMEKRTEAGQNAFKRFIATL